MVSHEIYDGPLFSINKKLLLCLGLWPYAGLSRIIMRVIYQMTMIGSSIPHIIASVVHYQDVDRLMLSLLAWLILLTIILKMLGLILAEKQMKQLFDELANNWVIIKDPEERKVLTSYAVRGKLVSIFYSVAMFGFGSTISLLPLTPKILDKLFPLDNGNPRQDFYLLKGEYFIQRNEHYLPIFFLDALATMSVATVTIVADTCYIIVVQQSCALYTIVSHRLRALRPMGSDVTTEPTVEMNSYDWLISTMRLHRTALEFTVTVNNAYSVSFFFILLVNMILVPLTACAIIANLDSVVQWAPFALLFGALTLHLFTLFYVGQRIVNHGEVVYDAAFCNQWYKIPKRTRQLLMIFMLRTSKSPTLTAGGILLINFETYATIMGRSLSYITVLASFR